MYVCFFLNMSSRILNKSDACIFFQILFVCMDFFSVFPHPPHHFSNGPSLAMRKSFVSAIPIGRLLNYTKMQ